MSKELSAKEQRSNFTALLGKKGKRIQCQSSVLVILKLTEVKAAYKGKSFMGQPEGFMRI